MPRCPDAPVQKPGLAVFHSVDGRDSAPAGGHPPVKTTIYYYTATGNSFAIARSLAEGLGDTEIVPLARFRSQRTSPRAERVGIIFPIHAWGPPRTVTEFVGNLDLCAARFVFAVASCGGTAAGALPRLAARIRKNGGRLRAGFIVRSTGYMESDGKEAGMIQMVRNLSGKPFPTDKERMSEIIEAVKNERAVRPERSAFLGSLLGNFFHRVAEKQFAGMDAAYAVSDRCASCGTCARVCPRANVRLESGRPAWHHDCDFCGACATWCVQGAIGLRDVPSSGPRRHHPGVSLSDLIGA
jgi:Pyruvate/2-oxoacid:ferredoxin oxidoreductase delta subunit